MGRRKRGRKGKEEGGVKGGRKWRRGESNFKLCCSFSAIYCMHAHMQTILFSQQITPSLSHLLSCSVLLDDFLRDHQEAELQFAPLPFNHPLFIMYSSGTTGPPKCMVHSQGVSPYNCCLVDMLGTPLHAQSSLLDSTCFS